MKKEREQNQKEKKKRLWKFMVGVCAVVLVFSVYSIGRTLFVSEREKDTFSDLIQMAEETDQGGNLSLDPAASEEVKSEASTGKRISTRNYARLKEENPDFAGWLKVEGTKIDYPVMHTPNDMQYYIRRDFYGKNSVSGTPFIGSYCNANSDSVIIYAHNMKNGTMFGELDLYESEEFRDQHPILQFDTPEEVRDYEIFAAFRTKLVYEGQEGFRYYEYVGDMTEDRFDEFMDQLKEVSYYQNDSWPEYGDKLVILSTCSYHTEDGRFVVVAKQAE